MISIKCGPSEVATYVCVGTTSDLETTPGSARRHGPRGRKTRTSIIDGGRRRFTRKQLPRFDRLHNQNKLFDRHW